MQKTLLRNLLLCLLGAGVVLVLGYVVYRHGYNHGSQEVRLQWEQDKAAAQAAYAELFRQMDLQQEAHREVQERIARDLVQVRQQHEEALAVQRTVYEQRLLQSARRADVYRSQAETGAASCRDLAGHAARLDEALEEGRDLVRELGSTLGLRDHQLKLLSGQIRNDRQLCEGQAHAD